MVARSMRAKTVWAATVLAVAVGMVGAASASAESGSSFHGVFAETLTGSNAGYDIHGSVKMTIDSAAWMARVSSVSTNARSVVVHEPGSGARIACADLQ